MLPTTALQDFPLHCRKCKLDAIVNIGGAVLRAERPLGTLPERKPQLKCESRS
ncbi:MAG: cysteine-rich KTR domain-containing protein [Agathobaculum sp.]|nr:cysteine-rich KTR domain-containing protein [Agathobaculum sp.]